MFALTFQLVNVVIENANASLTLAGNYVIGLGHNGSPVVIEANPAVQVEAV